MRIPPLLLTLLPFLPSTLALPTTSPYTLPASALLKLAPSTASCASPPAPGECRTAAQAAPYLSISFLNFNITSFSVQAALVSLNLYESADFKYSKNHFPGVPGQGTRNMQSPAFNLQYATWLATKCANCGISMADVDKAKAGGVVEVLALVNGDEWGFGSAAWFYATQCDDQVKKGLEGGTEAGWAEYLTGCVGTSVTGERTAVWRKAMAMGKW